MPATWKGIDNNGLQGLSSLRSMTCPHPGPFFCSRNIIKTIYWRHNLRQKQVSVPNILSKMVLTCRPGGIRIPRRRADGGVERAGWGMGKNSWALIEANRIRIEMLSETEPGWSETLEQTAAYLDRLGKTPLDYVEAWLAFKPSLAALRRRHTQPAPSWSGHRLPRLGPRDPDRVFANGRVTAGGRWFVG